MNLTKFFNYYIIIVIIFVETSICSLDRNDYQMIIAYGIPLEYSTPKVHPLSFEECVEKCLNDSSCVLVYETSPSCQMFKLADIVSVQRLNNSNRVAFRIYSPGNSCLDSSELPILIGGTVTGRTYYTSGNNLPTYQEFNLTLNFETSIWNFTSSVYYPCSENGLPTKRGDTVYCVYVTYMATCINKTQALSEISKKPGHSIMVIANMAEYEAIKNIALTYVTETGGLGFWMDGIRKPTCTYPAQRSASCNGTNEFDFTDKSAPNPVFKWVTGEPNLIEFETKSEGGLVLRVMRSLESGVDDTLCSGIVSTVCFAGFIHGTKAIAKSVG